MTFLVYICLHLGANNDVFNVELWFNATFEVPESILVSIRLDDFHANGSVKCGWDSIFYHLTSNRHLICSF